MKNPSPYLWMLAFVLVLNSCKKNLTELVIDKSQSGGTITYLIKKGNHNAEQSAVVLADSNGIYCTVRFDSSAVYQTAAAANQGDVNKLIGFSDCGTQHQENSARLGWSWNGRQVQLYAYAYVNKQRVIHLLSTANINQPVNCSVTAKDGYYYFSTGDKKDSIARYCNNNNSNRYKLFPYFGGDEAAPHDITIMISEEKLK